MLDTDKCVLLVYPNGASGKFLLNCLCMNKEFCLQVGYEELTQYNDEVTQQRFLIDKLRSFIDRNQDNFIWDDLSMGDQSFFRIPNYSPEKHDFKTYLYFMFYSLRQSQSINYAITNNKYFFRIVHNYESFIFYSTLFPNAKIVELKNNSNWINARNKNSNCQTKFVDKSLSFGILNSFIFDNDSFFNKDTFLQEYSKLMIHLDVPVKNIDKVIEFYDLYVPYILGTK